MLNLSQEELLVLFEFTHRICETNTVAAGHAAEVVVIDKIASYLEQALSGLREPDYGQQLSQARTSILTEYLARMGDRAWVQDVAITQT